MTARNLSAALAGAIFLLLTPAAMASDDAERPFRTISLSGTSEVQARPDTARVNTGVVTEGADARSALAANSAAMAELFKSLKDMGIADRDMQTRNFNISPRYAPYNRAQPARENRIIGYRVTNSVAVRVRNLESLGPMLDKLAGAGANQVNGISFYVDEADNLMDEARRRAIADARRKAELYATEAGARLKRILTISESGARPGPQPVFRAMAARDAKESVPVAAGEQTIRASVAVTYELE